MEKGGGSKEKKMKKWGSKEENAEIEAVRRKKCRSGGK
jgi:hypothetical protein